MGLRECPCKFRLGIEGNEAPATVQVVVDTTPLEPLEGTINFSAIECFTGGPNCNPAVDNFEINFGDNEGNTINFTQGRRGMISCEDNTVAILTEGTAQASGNVLPAGDYTVNFTYTIVGDTATVTIEAFNQDGSAFTTTFVAPVSSSPQTFIGDCEDTVSGM